MTFAEFPSLTEAFDEAAARNPGQILSFPSENERLTYAELADSSRRMAAGLLADGATEGGTIGILCPNGAAFLQAVLAAGRIGAAACPLPLPIVLRDIEGYLRRTQGIIDTASVSHVVTVAKMRAVTEQLTGPRVREAAGLVAAGGPVPLPRPAAGHPAVIQFTSGSTFAPKGVVLSQTNVLSCADSITSAIAIGPDDGWGSWLPLFHDMGLFGTLTGLFNGLPVTIWSPTAFVRNPGRWLKEFLRTPATINAMPNFGFDNLVDAVPAERVPSLDMSRWRVAFNGAESLSVASVRGFLDHFAPAGFRPAALLPAFGMAEATLLISLPPQGRAPVYDWVDRAALAERWTAVPLSEADPGARGVVGLGRAAPGMTFRVASQSSPDPQHPQHPQSFADSPDREQELPDGRVGEIQVRGSSVTSGYLGGLDDPFTADGWLRTGDLGYRRDGELYFTGRSKEMITVRGANVYPMDIESVARTVPGVHKGRCVAFALTEDSEHEQIMLCAETRLSEPAERDRLSQEIRARCTSVLGLSQLTVQLVAARSIPRTTSGKLQRLGMRDHIIAEANS
ncbi:AMP-binding protein [Streptomyces sp. NPDC048637]|uniref:AMP-binding protein n=1 Tax=Streptomyces sp. NPDC048637 TaxID=3155636 RepID=UPI003419A55A